MAPVRRHPRRCSDLEGGLWPLGDVGLDQLHLEGGAFSSGFSGKYRLLDKDPYWVDHQHPLGHRQ
ncbi:hypothetical protein [Streptomyces collinus]|uniref:hypothetical protein n=1 Tax=Streptomyces collinus TaxID=42684 RepID=UPI0036B2104F